MQIKSGDTLSQIAKKEGMTLKALLAANPSIKNANQIRVGQNIIIPPKSMIGKGNVTSNPYKGMTRGERNALAEDTRENRERLAKQKETGKPIPRNKNSFGNKSATLATEKMRRDVKDRGTPTTAVETPQSTKRRQILSPKAQALLDRNKKKNKNK
jgi:LysM repeat protein